MITPTLLPTNGTEAAMSPYWGLLGSGCSRQAYGSALFPDVVLKFEYHRSVDNVAEWEMWNAAPAEVKEFLVPCRWYDKHKSVLCMDRVHHKPIVYGSAASYATKLGRHLDYHIRNSGLSYTDLHMGNLLLTDDSVHGFLVCDYADWTIDDS